MFRRSRLSVRPNVGTTGRTAGAPQETSSNKEPENVNTTAEPPVTVTDSPSVEAPAEPSPGADQSGEAAGSSALQRRKRFSVRPKVVPGRPSALPRTPKSPIRPVLPAVKNPSPAIDKSASAIEVSGTAPIHQDPPQKESQSADESPLPQTEAISPSEGLSGCLDPPGRIQTSSFSQVKDISPKAPVPPSIPDREATDISEKAKTLVSKTELKTSSQHFSLTQLLNDKSDLLRLEKAQKLRQLLKQEMLKEKSKKHVARAKEFTLDPGKMTMRDLIHYLPTSNPMTSTLEDSAQENETAIPHSPGEMSPERAQEQEVPPKMPSPPHREAAATTSAEGDPEQEEEEAEEDEEALMVPQVKVAEDGSLIIDEESLTVEVQRMKGPNPIQDRDPIFERGSTTTYSSFRKGTHTKPWSTEETDMFFLAISMVGTDFAMISQLFPHRARSEIKNKFKKEERHNTWRIDKAFRERRKLDLVYFNKLLEKILEFQKSKKKLKSISEKPKPRKRKAKDKKAMAELSDVEEENEDGASIEEQEGEKENVCNEKTSSSKTKRKRKNKDDHSPESPADKKKKKRKTKKLSDDVNEPADLDDAPVSLDHLSLHQSEDAESAASKPAESKSLPLGRRRQKAKKANVVVSDSEGEPTNEETEIQNDNVLSRQSAKTTTDNDSSDHEITLQPARPSRYGRISKPVQPLNYPAKEDTNSSASETQSTASAKAKNKNQGKRRKSAQQKPAKESKKPKLITLRASQSDGSDDDDEEEPAALHFDEYDNENSAFVPASLCSPKPVVPEVEETMEELDMLAHMPDVLGMSENALCPDASCEQNDRGTVEPCEHQLDLLVDVIDFLSEHAEASEDESYNEAAQTLLAIGNLAQPTESQPPSSVHISELESGSCGEEDEWSKPTFQQEESVVLTSEPSETKNITIDSPVEQSSTSLTPDTNVVKPMENFEDLSNTEETPTTKNTGSPPRKEELFNIKPTLNTDDATRTTELLTQTIDSTMERQLDELDIVATSQHHSLGQLKESTPTFTEPTNTDSRSADDTTVVVPTSQVNYESCSKEDTVDSFQVQKTAGTKMTSSPSMRQRLSKIKPNISCAVRTTKQSVEAVEKRTHVESEITKTNERDSLKESTPAKQDESCSTQSASAISQPETTCSNNSSTQRKGRFTKVKPTPNIGCASRTAKQSTQSVHAIEGKLQNEPEMAETSQPGSAKHESESTQTLSEQSICQNETTSSTKEKIQESLTSDSLIDHGEESSSTLQTSASSQLETISSISSPSPLRKGRLSKIKPKPNIERASRNMKQSTSSVHALEEKLQNESEMVSASQPGSLKHDVESTQTALEQSSCQNEATSSPTNEMSESHPSIKQVLEHRDKSSSTQATASSSQVETLCSENSSTLRQRRLPKIKPKPNTELALRTTKRSTQSVHVLEEKSQNKSELIMSASQPSSSIHDVESTQTVSEQSNCQNKFASLTNEEMPETCASDSKMIDIDESSSTQETASSSQLETLQSETSSGLRKGRFSKIKPKPNIERASRTTKQSLQSAQVLEKKSQNEPELMVSTSLPGSSNPVVESTQTVSEQSSCPNKLTSSTKELLTSSSSNTQVIEPGDKSSAIQETASSSQLETLHSETSSALTKGRFSKIKPKPNIERASRKTKQSLQSIHVLEEKSQSKPELILSTSLPGSSEHEEESTQTSSTQETVSSSQVESLCSESSSALKKGRFSKIKPKPNIERASRTTKQSPQSVHANEEKLQNESEMASASQPGSSQHEVESNQKVSEQSNCQNKTTRSTKEAMPMSHSSDTQVIEHNESSSTQESSSSSQLEMLHSETPSPLRRGRFSKIKPKPNIIRASRTTKQSSQSVDTTDEEHQTVGETAAVTQLPLSESVMGSFGDFHQESLAIPSKGTETLPHSQFSEPQEQVEELRQPEKHVEPVTEESCSVKPLEQPRSAEFISPLEMPSTQCGHSSAEEKTENIPVKLPGPSSESLRHSTPQRRSWIPKVKPKPNLASSPRTAKSRVESKEKNQATMQLVQSGLVSAMSEQPILQEPHDQLQSITLEPHSASSIPSMLGVSSGATVQTPVAAGCESTSTLTEEGPSASKTDKIYEDPVTVQDHCEPATNQTDVDRCSLMECAPSDFPKSSKTVYQLQDLTLKNTEVCPESRPSSLFVETSEMSTDHTRPAEGAAEPPSELQPSDAALPLGLDQVQDSFELKSFLFPTIPPDQVPSDPDEPFFILSLTEIPVCPSGEEVHPMPEPYHALPESGARQSNPADAVVPFAAGNDDSLSNIYIPTPEKATLKSGLIRVEEYLPTAPSVDISLLEEPREKLSSQRPHLPEDKSTIELQDALSANEQPSAEGDVKESRKQHGKNNKPNKPENMSQDPPESFSQTKIGEQADSEPQKDSDGSAVMDRLKTAPETRGNKDQKQKSKTSGVSLWGKTETQSSEATAADVLTDSTSWKDNPSTSSSSELLQPNVKDSPNVSDEGPTIVSEYFLCDVFTEVVNSDCAVTGNKNGDLSCNDKMPPAETKANLSQHSQSPCGHKSTTTAPETSEAAAEEATSCHVPDSSATETNVQTCQQDNKSRGRGKGIVKRKTPVEAKAKTSRPQRKSTAAKLPEAPSQDSLIESTSSSSTLAPETHKRNQPSSSEIQLSHQRDSIRSSSLEEEHTNVSQSFFSDVFIEVVNDDVTGKSSSSFSGSDTTQSQKDKRQKRKASSDLPSGQPRSLTEEQPLETTSSSRLQKTPSSTDTQRDTKKTSGQGSSRRSCRKSAEALKSSEAPDQDSLKETHSRRTQRQRGSVLGSAKVPVDKEHSSVEADSGSGSVTKTRKKDDDRGVKPQSQTSETSRNTKQRKTKAASRPPLIQEQTHEGSVSHDLQKPSVDPAGKGRLNEKNTGSDGAQQQKQDTSASKSPMRVKETASASSVRQLEIQQNNQSDNEEPTNVSQFFVSDIFTDVDEEFRSPRK